MEQGSEISKRVEKALSSIDGIERAVPQPWFFARIKARLSKEEKTVWVKIGSFLSKPVVAIAGLCLVLTLNAVLLLNQKSSTPARPYGQFDQLPLSENETII